MVSTRKGFFITVLLATLVAGTGFGQVRVHLTGDAVASFQYSPNAQQILASFTTAKQPLYWGLGWEVIHRHLGFGGLYAADFTRITASVWWLDWYGEALYLSYHLFRRRTLIDPFVSVGLGSAGRVYLGPSPSNLSIHPALLLSIFPVVSGGLGLDLDGLYVSLKLSHLPVVSPPPATPFENVPLGRFLAAASVGIALGR